uniref:Uncharacterized protein n=1 Tax=Arundo donax TaxID=35708 RepID=A0A0A9BQX1_ARUDO
MLLFIMQCTMNKSYFGETLFVTENVIGRLLAREELVQRKLLVWLLCCSHATSMLKICSNCRPLIWNTLGCIYEDLFCSESKNYAATITSKSHVSASLLHSRRTVLAL